MSKEFPHECSNCGFCCLSQICPIGRHMMGVPDEAANQPCPALKWDEEGKSYCDLPSFTKSPLKKRVIDDNPEMFKEAMGFGEGCCISARVIHAESGEVVDFASMLPSEKECVVENFCMLTGIDRKREPSKE